MCKYRNLFYVLRSSDSVLSGNQKVEDFKILKRLNYDTGTYVEFRSAEDDEEVLTRAFGESKSLSVEDFKILKRLN